MRRTARTLPPVPACEPTGPLTLPEIPAHVCGGPHGCGAPLTPVDNGRNEWSYYDAEGRAYVDNFPEELKTPEGWATLVKTDPGTYSYLSMNWPMLYTFTHAHQPVQTEPFRGEGPFCCSQPMRLAPNGWTCRKTERVFPYIAE